MGAMLHGASRCHSDQEKCLNDMLSTESGKTSASTAFVRISEVGGRHMRTKNKYTNIQSIQYSFRRRIGTVSNAYSMYIENCILVLE